VVAPGIPNIAAAHTGECVTLYIKQSADPSSHVQAADRSPSSLRAGSGLESTANPQTERLNRRSPEQHREDLFDRVRP